MKKTIITVSREFGSGGHTIAKRVAQRLGYAYFDKELIEQVAENTGLHRDFVAERGEYAPSASRFAYAFISRGADGISLEDTLWNAQRELILNIADTKAPCVIVGRCADYLLRHREDALHVYIHADKEFRANRIVELYGETDAKPEKRLDEKDKKRRINYNYYTGRDWGAVHNYHLSLNSGVLGTDRCVDLTVAACGE